MASCSSSQRLSLPGNLEGRRLLVPALELILAPIDQVVHVLEQLCPCHDAWGGIWRDEIFALRAVGICTDLLAHLFADASKLGLELHAMLQVYFRFCVFWTRLACFFFQVLSWFAPQSCRLSMCPSS